MDQADDGVADMSLDVVAIPGRYPYTWKWFELPL